VEVALQHHPFVIAHTPRDRFRRLWCPTTRTNLEPLGEAPELTAAVPVDSEPRAHLGAFLAVHHHAVGTKVKGGRLTHHLQFAISAEQAEVGLAELADRAARDQLNERPPLQLPETVRRP